MTSTTTPVVELWCRPTPAIPLPGGARQCDTRRERESGVIGRGRGCFSDLAVFTRRRIGLQLTLRANHPIDAPDWWFGVSGRGPRTERRFRP